MKTSAMHPTKVIYSQTGATAESKAAGEILEGKECPEPARALRGLGTKERRTQMNFQVWERELISSILAF